MILDLHAHSIKSDDGRAKVQNYCQWIRTRNLPIDGFVLTEHRQFDFESDYSALAADSGLVILKGSEVETEYGHVLVFGVATAIRRMTEQLDFTNIRLALTDVLAVAHAAGAVAVPCHPGRPRVGMAAHIGTYGIPQGVSIVETYNGGSRDNEDAIAQALASEQGYRGIGGSDAHIVSHIGRCATRFSVDIHNEAELVEALKAGDFEAITFREQAA
ncbi:MAG: PHP domain-containing protein [Pseudomonadales bacterium]|nr:PHP domain-containing protein [Pseudomonadales bacterium]